MVSGATLAEPAKRKTIVRCPTVKQVTHHISLSHVPGCPPLLGQPFDGLPCSSPSLQCPYNEQCCCGECAPLIFTCTSTHGASYWQASSPCTNPTCGVGCQKGSTKGLDYGGTASTTIGGLACLPWATFGFSEFGGGKPAYNFCRNQGKKKHFPVLREVKREKNLFLVFWEVKREEKKVFPLFGK